VAAVAWLAELFPNPRQREAVLGYTQAFSSVGGLLVTGAYWLVNRYADMLPPIYGEHSAWRYTLISGVIPALPLILIRPFLPESPAWQRKRQEGTLQRPSFGQLFQPMFRRTTLVTAALFACGYGAAFGAIQMTPQIVPGLNPELGPLTSLREAYEGAKNPEKRDDLKKRFDDAKAKYEAALSAQGADAPAVQALKTPMERAQRAFGAATAASKSDEKMGELRGRVETLQKTQEETVANVQFFQEIGGLVGRFALAWLALRIVSRRKLLWLFQVPGLLLIPLVFALPAAGNLPANNLEWLKAGIFVTGFFTVAQFSFWGNYLPRVYPTFLRGTGESFAANVGGRMFGTSANFLTTRIAPMILAAYPTLARPSGIAYAAAGVALGVYLLGSLLTFFLPEPKEEFSHD
jgi:hypothetical protein